MLTLRRDQIEALHGAGVSRFEARAVEHVRRCVPDEAAALGEDGVRALVRRAITRGREYALEDEYDFLRLLNLFLVFGPDCDTDAAQPWIGESLRERGQPPRLRMDRLMARAEVFDASPEEDPALEFEDAPPLEPEADAPEPEPDDAWSADAEESLEQDLELPPEPWERSG